MKRFTTLAICLSLLTLSATSQSKKDLKKAKETAAKEVKVTTQEAVKPVLTTTPVKALPDAAPAGDVAQIDAFAKFDKTEHNFGTVPEGPQAITEFKVKNVGKEPLTINNVQASCGCTVPEWTKEPIAPGATGKIKAIYNTSGRPGGINKSLTVTTNKGTKMLTLKGLVEKAPDTSVPANNNSMIKTN